MRFPLKEAEVLALAQNVQAGLVANADVFPDPPVTPEVLSEDIAAYQAAKAALTAAQAAVQRALVDKDGALDAVKEAVKPDLRYAENITNYADDKLKLLGWGSPKSPIAMQRPGQTRGLTVASQGESSVTLQWAKPVNGGEVSAYDIMRRERDGGRWEHVGTAVEPERVLTKQPKGKALEYHVIAINKAGNGQPSNTVTVVL